jgi:two-component system, cell cycle response regulator
MAPGIVCRDTEPTGATALAERLRQLIAERLVCVDAVEPPTTVSMGIAGMSDDSETPTALFDAADRQLHRAKSDGRNGCCCP